MLQSLETAYEFVTTTPRLRKLNEVHPRISAAYIDLIFAWAYSRTPDGQSRGQELIERAKAAVPTEDRIHQMILRAYQLRIDEHKTSPWTRLVLDLDALEPFHKYTVVRFLENSPILSRVETLDAMRQFFQHPKPLETDDEITALLLADSEGRHDTVRAGVRRLGVEGSRIGATLIGPSARALCSDELHGTIRRRHERKPHAVSAAALVALGDTDIAYPPDADSAGIGPQKQNAWAFAGALSLAGRTDEAVELLARGWREASDNLRTNSHFCLALIRATEAIVLSTLRHELALGNKTQLDSVRPVPEIVRPAPVLQLVPASQARLTRRGLLQVLEDLRAAFQYATTSAEPQMQNQLEALVARFDSFIGKYGQGVDLGLGVTWLAGVLGGKSVAQAAQTRIELGQEAMARVPGELGFQFVHTIRRLIVDAAAILPILERHDRDRRDWLQATMIGIANLDAMLRSTIAERPSMPSELQVQLATFTSQPSLVLAAGQRVLDRYSGNIPIDEPAMWRTQKFSRLMLYARRTVMGLQAHLANAPEGIDDFVSQARVKVAEAARLTQLLTEL